MARATISARTVYGALEVMASPSTTPPSSPAWTTSNTSGRSPLRARSATATSSVRRPTSQISPLLNGNDGAGTSVRFLRAIRLSPISPGYGLCPRLSASTMIMVYYIAHVDASMDRSQCQFTYSELLLSRLLQGVVRAVHVSTKYDAS